MRHEAEARGLARHQPENMKIFGEDVRNTTKNLSKHDSAQNMNLQLEDLHL